jgi:endonuclease YncB( thermonuclease family)
LRLRVVTVDGDGTLVVVLRCNGKNPAVALLRAGLVRTRGTGSRRYRQAQSAAQLQRRGLRRLAEFGPSQMASPPALPAELVFT